MRPGIWFVLAIAIGVLITNLGAARLWDRDEPRNAQCAREMLESGNWIVPTFDGELRTHKPVLLYWCQIAAYKIFGVDEFSARLPSAIASLLTVLCVFWIGKRLGGEQTAVWSAIALSTMILFVMAGRAATPDALLIANSTLAVATFVHFAFVPRVGVAAEGDFLRAVEFRLPSRPQWALVYAACGLAVLAKGPVGLVLPVAVMGLTILLTDQRPGKAASADHVVSLTKANEAASPKASPDKSSDFLFRMLSQLSNWTIKTVVTGWQMRPFLAVGVTLLVAGPWYLAVGIATEGEWLRDFFFTHNVDRAVKPMEGHSGPPVLFYVAALLVGTFPWSCFAIPVGLSVWRRVNASRREGRPIDPLIALAIAWTTVYVGCFSIASTKLPSYVTPCHPGIALVVGWYVSRAIAGQIDHPRWLRAGLAVAFLIGVGIFVTLGGPVAQLLPAVRPLAFAGVVFAVAGLLGVALAVRAYAGLAMRTFVIGAVSIVWMLHGFGPMVVDRGRSDLDALQAAFASSPERIWWMTGSPEPSWVFYSNRRIRTGAATQIGFPVEESAKIEIVSQGTAGDTKVFLQDRFLRIIDTVSPRIADRNTQR